MTDRLGDVTTDGDVVVLAFVRRLPYPVERVWSAITDPAERAQWFGETVLEGRAGGRIDMIPSGPPLAAERKRLTGKILVWDPPRVFEHEWRQAIVADSVVRYELEPDGADTVLHFSHRGLSVRDARGFAPGTHAYLDRLAAYLVGTEPPDWLVRYREAAAHYPGWANL